jgi:2'-5' RNA ligase
LHHISSLGISTITEESVRTFVALAVPKSAKELIVQAQQKWIRISRSRVSWARPDGIHLTLAFLGDVPTAQINGMAQALGEIASQHGVIGLGTTQTGAFPSWNRPRVIWWGVDGGEELLKLQRDTTECLKQLGFELEDRFHPHLTIARIKSLERGDRLVNAAQTQTFEPVHWTAKDLLLMSSALKPGGAEYKVLAALSFRNAE